MSSLTRELLGRHSLRYGSEMLWEVLPGHRVASLGFFYSVGSREDPVGKEGVAHFVEHFLFKGTRSFSATSLAREIERLGGEINAYTDRAEIGFTCTVPVASWETALLVLIELCCFPTFPQHEFQKEKNVILSEIQSANEDPEELSYESFLSRIHPGHPELHPVGGTVSSVEKLTLEDLSTWKMEFLRDSALVFAWAGDLDPLAVESRFESLRGVREQTLAKRHLPPVLKPRGFVDYENSDFQMLQVLLGWHYPQKPEILTSLGLQIFSTFWAETMISRLFQNLRENLGLCYAVGSQVWETEDLSGVHTFLSASPEQAIELLHALRVQIKELEVPPSVQEWEDAKNALAGSLLIASERSEARMVRLFAHWNRWRSIPVWGETYQQILSLDREPFWTTWKNACQLDQTSLLLWGKGAKKILKKAGWP